jgi:hypothetical protein
MGNGRVLYTFGEPQMVMVSNNINMPGDLIRDGYFFDTISRGSTVRVPLTYNLNSNTVLIFKAFEVGADGQKIYRGQVTRIFTPQSGGGYSQEWTIDYVQPPR